MWQRDGLATPEAIRRSVGRDDRGPRVRGFFVQATPQTGLMASPFWRPVVEPLLFPSPLSGTLQDALAQDDRSAYSQWFDEHGQVDVYLLIDWPTTAATLAARPATGFAVRPHVLPLGGLLLVCAS